MSVLQPHAESVRTLKGWEGGTVASLEEVTFFRAVWDLYEQEEEEWVESALICP